VPTALLKNRLAAPRALPPGGRPSDEELGFTPALSAETAGRLWLAEPGFGSFLQMDGALGSTTGSFPGSSPSRDRRSWPTTRTSSTWSLRSFISCT